jgi:aerobic C4-dicarboxylate transport protein
MALRPTRSLYLWVLVAVAVGALLGLYAPSLGIAMKPLGDGFIKLIRMLVAPIVFTTVVLGIAQMKNLGQVGRVGLKAVAYFEVLSTLALVLGVVVANVLRPGDGFHVDLSQLDAGAASQYISAAHEQSVVAFLLNVIPSTLPGALTSGELLQVLLVAVLTGFGAALSGESARPFVSLMESSSAILFRVVSLVMWLAPIGAFGAMAFTLGKFGWHSLAPLARFMGVFYLTCIAFVVLVLGTVARLCGFRVLALVRYLRTEILTVIGTSSSESALAPLMDRLERLGCQRSTVGLVVPTGYSFNLDGTCIYLSLAAIFLAQALDVTLTLGQQVSILAVAMLTSKGAAAITGGGFITLTATLAVVPGMPVEAIALILGIDRFMSEARAVTNLIGNAVATLVISRWEGEVDGARIQAGLSAPS